MKHRAFNCLLLLLIGIGMMSCGGNRAREIATLRLPEPAQSATQAQNYLALYETEFVLPEDWIFNFPTPEDRAGTFFTFNDRNGFYSGGFQYWRNDYAISPYQATRAFADQNKSLVNKQFRRVVQGDKLFYLITGENKQSGNDYLGAMFFEDAGKDINYVYLLADRGMISDKQEQIYPIPASYGRVARRYNARRLPDVADFECNDESYIWNGDALRAKGFYVMHRIGEQNWLTLAILKPDSAGLAKITQYPFLNKGKLNVAPFGSIEFSAYQVNDRSDGRIEVNLCLQGTSYVLAVIWDPAKNSFSPANIATEPRVTGFLKLLRLKA